MKQYRKQAMQKLTELGFSLAELYRRRLNDQRSAEVKRRFNEVVLLVLISLIFLPPVVHAQSDSAYNNASCGASFLNLCPNVETTTSTGGGLAAPIPVLGAAIWELAVIFGGLGGVWFFGRRKSRQTGSKHGR